MNTSNSFIFHLLLLSFFFALVDTGSSLEAQNFTIRVSSGEDVGEVLQDHLPKRFISSFQNRKFILCPSHIKSDGMTRAIAILAKKFEKQNFSQSVAEEKQFDANSYKLDECDHNGATAVLNALEFLQVDEEFIDKLTASYEARFGMTSEKAFTRAIMRENFSTLFDHDSELADQTRPFPKDLKEMGRFCLSDYYKTYLEELRKPTTEAKRKLALRFLQSTCTNNFLTNPLDQESLQKLEIVSGSKGDTVNFLAHKLDRTSTELGRVSLYAKLAQGNSSVDGCEQQRAVVEYLIARAEFCETLSKEYQIIQRSESVVLNFWNDRDYQVANFRQMLYPMSSSLISALSEKITDICNASPSTSKILQVGLGVAGIGCTVCMIKNHGISLKTDINQLISSKLTVAAVVGGAFAVAKIFSSLDSLQSTCRDIPDQLNAYFLPRLVYRLQLMHLALYLKAAKDLQQALMKAKQDGGSMPKKLLDLLETLSVLDKAVFENKVRKAVEQIREIQADTKHLIPAILLAPLQKLVSLDENSLLNDLLNATDAIQHALEEHEKGKKQSNGSVPKNLLCAIQTLIDLTNKQSLYVLLDNLEAFETEALSGNLELPTLWQSLFSSQWLKFGLVISCYKQVLQNKHLLLPVIGALGELDAQLSIAKLYSEHKDKGTKFCIPKFTSSEQPYLSITHGWNPMIKSNQPTPNSITLGGKVKKQLALITGPNTGGKSTMVKSAIIGCVIAQSFGIAPCDSLELTPFRCMRAYLNIKDNLAGGQSLFDSCVARVKAIISAVDVTAKQQGHSLAVFDEPYNGTNPSDAEEHTFALLKSFAQKTGAITLATTHFTRVAGHLKDDVDNYHIPVSRNNHTGELNRTFSLTEGVCSVSVANDILRENKMPKEIMQIAERYRNEVINRHAVN